MEILIYLVPAVLGVALWIGISELLEKALGKKTDSFWKKEKIDTKTEDRMRYSIKKKVEGK